MSAVRSISIIAAMLDEIEHVDDLAHDIAAQDFDGELEVFVADGGSTDGSRQRLQALMEQLDVPFTLIDNPLRFVSPGLNLCIARATGDLVVRLDCHSRYPRDYVRRCAEAAESTGAWNVGGIAEPLGRTTLERAVACAMASPFGGINWTRQGSSRREADTVFLGAFRPIAFEQVGPYDEAFVRNQDDELNLRIRLAGGKVVLDPAIKATYTPRGSLRAVWRQYRQYGFWKVAVMRKHRQPPGVRSLVPALFVLQLATVGGLATVSRTARLLLAADVGFYSLAAFSFAVRAVRQRGEPASLVPAVVLTFPCFHLGYGTGMLEGAVTAIGRRSWRPESTETVGGAE